MALLDTFKADNLIATNAHALTSQTVVVASGEGILSRGSVLMRNSSNKFVLAGASVVGADNPSTKPWHELDANGVYTPSEDTVATAIKDYYSIVADASTQPTANPKTEEYFERSGSSPYVYTPTNDTTVDAEKTYYAVTATKQTSVDYGTATAFGSAEVILAADVDATSADAVAEVYNSGDFFENFLIVTTNYALTEADKLNLKNAGIYLVAGME